jgi:hypothetical protein
VEPKTITLSEDETINDKSINVYVTTKNIDVSTCDVYINNNNIGSVASQSICAVGSNGANIELDKNYASVGTNTLKVIVKDKNGKEYTKTTTFNITKSNSTPTYLLDLINETCPDNTIINVSSADKITKLWTIKNISNHSAHLILEQDKSKTCNLNLLTTPDNIEEFDLKPNESNQFIHNYQMPTKAGVYECYYKIKDKKGHYYTVNGSNDIWIKVKVQTNPLLVNTDFNSEIKVNSKAIMSIQINNGNPPYKYNITWSDGEKTDISTDYNNYSFSHLYTKAGTYKVTVTITDKTGKEYSKTYTLKVSDKVSQITSWSGYVDAVKTSGINTGDVTHNIVISNEKYNNINVNAYSINYTKQSDDKVYYTGYKLPVPQGLIKLDKKVRVTFVTKIDTTTGFWNYDREYWLRTDNKKYGAVIEDAKDGQNKNGVFVVKDLLKGIRTDTNVSDFVDFVVENEGNSTYALDLDENGINVEKYVKNINEKYEYTKIYEYPDITGNYLTQIHIDFKGKGKIILAYLQYDKNGNGKFDKNESLILNTADGKVDWEALMGTTDTTTVSTMAPEYNPLKQNTLFPGHYPGMWANTYAFAALKNDGTVVTWGYSDDGGDSSSVADKLTNVKAIYSTENAFAALKNDGTVVIWGDSGFGGDSSKVQDKLHDVVGFSPSYTKFPNQ